LEAEIVTADGAVRIANACINPYLFWALKGGGGGSLGVVTRLTLRAQPSAELRRRREHNDQGSVGRSLPSPDRSDRQILQR
jgi:FAD/FMN-containing dehydrogenase